MNQTARCALALVSLIAACSRRDASPTRDDTQQRSVPPPIATPAPPPVAPGFGTAALIAGAGTSGSAHVGHTDADRREAEAEFDATKGIKLKGEAKFEETTGGVKIHVEVKDAPPGVKGIHVHEKPDCSDIPGKSMGEHFAPNAKVHGLPPNPTRHLGDLGNITIDKDGKGRLDATVANANLKEGDPMSFVGRAIVIHEGEDKGTQPSGGSGRPMACGVIKKE